MSARAVFLDRDGVLNRALVHGGHPHPPDDVDQLEVLPGVPEALTRLKGAGFELIVVTNQPDVARGRQTRELVERMNARLAAQLPLDDIYICYHDDGDACACRKPKPGLIVRAGHVRDIELARSYVVGDRWRDIDAGHAAGCRTLLIDYGYDEALKCSPDVRVASMSEAADWILEHVRKEGR